MNKIRIDAANTKEFVLHLDVLSTKKATRNNKKKGGEEKVVLV
jgi:hypothetical protein